MKFDFPIDKVEYEFDLVGDCDIEVTLNKHPVVGNVIDGDLLKGHDVLGINFSKTDPTDTESYATLKKFNINDGDFLDQIKVLGYNVDKSKHKEAEDQISNNLYFGYVGSMEIVLEQTKELLKKAAWTIADKEFEYVKWPSKGKNHRHKDFRTVLRDAEFMYTGSTPPLSKDITIAVNETRLQDLRGPFPDNVEHKLIDWMSKSERCRLDGEPFKHFTFSNGVSDSLESFLRNSISVIMMPSKMYHIHGELLQGTDLVRLDPFERPIPLYADVLLEYPSPWYTNDELDNVIKLAKDKKAKIALDLTWLPVATDKIQLDLNGIDQIFFSMNKAWPIHDFRPAFRWSRDRINDRQTFDYEIGIYPKTSANIFMKLISEFSFDYIYNTNKDNRSEIMQTFDLAQTPVLWFTKHQSAVHDEKGHISEHYFLDEFVCIQKLLDHKGKYFW